MAKSLELPRLMRLVKNAWISSNVGMSLAGGHSASDQTKRYMARNSPRPIKWHFTSSDVNPAGPDG